MEWGATAFDHHENLEILIFSPTYIYIYFLVSNGAKTDTIT